MMKPCIDDVCQIFHDFQNNCTKASSRHSFLSKEYYEVIEKAKTILKDKLTKLGLAEHINWEPSK